MRAIWTPSVMSLANSVIGTHPVWFLVGGGIRGNTSPREGGDLRKILKSRNVSRCYPVSGFCRCGICKGRRPHSRDVAGTSESSHLVPQLVDSLGSSRVLAEAVGCFPRRDSGFSPGRGEAAGTRQRRGGEGIFESSSIRAGSGCPALVRHSRESGTH